MAAFRILIGLFYKPAATLSSFIANPNASVSLSFLICFSLTASLSLITPDREMLLFYVMAMIGGVLSTMIAILLISFLLDWAGSIFVNQKDGDKLRLILPVTLIPVIIANTIRIFGVTEFLVWMIALLSLYSSVLQIMAIRILKGLNIVKSIIVVVIALSIAISPWLIISYFLKIKNNPQPATITSEIISSQKHYQLWTYSV